MNASRRLCSLLMLLAAGGIEAADYRIDTTDSLVAVVTHKAGVAAGLAHDHLIVLGELPAQFEFDPDAPLETRLQFSSAVESLQVDPWARQQAIYPRLEQLGVLDSPYSELSDKERGKIRKAMLGVKQLDGEAHPRLSVRIESVATATAEDADFPYRVDLALTVKGETVRSQARARYELDENGLVIEGLADFEFTAFGIKPYSAMLGAVRNEDRFQVYIHLVAAP